MINGRKARVEICVSPYGCINRVAMTSSISMSVTKFVSIFLSFISKLTFVLSTRQTLFVLRASLPGLFIDFVLVM